MPEENPSVEEFERRMNEANKSPAEKLAANQPPAPEAVEEAYSESEDNEVAQLQEEIAQLQDKVLRTAAEMQNLRARTEKEIAEARKYGITAFARDLITVMEHMQLAISSIPQEKIEGDALFKNLHLGVKMTADELLGAFQKYGIKRVSPEIGEKFDHNFHQAMMEIPTAEQEPGSIVQVMQAGYCIHDRLIRPALVGVAKALPSAQSEAANEDAPAKEAGHS